MYKIFVPCCIQTLSNKSTTGNTQYRFAGLKTKAGYTAKDMTYIATTTGSQMGIVAKTSRGWKTLKDVISEAKKGKVFKFAGMSPKHADINYCLPCQAKLMSPAEFKLARRWTVIIWAGRPGSSPDGRRGHWGSSPKWQGAALRGCPRRRLNWVAI